MEGEITMWSKSGTLLLLQPWVLLPQIDLYLVNAAASRVGIFTDSKMASLFVDCSIHF